jgi:hypothetical protein
VNPDIPQFDGNANTDTASATSIIDCMCCDIVSDSTNWDSDYDLDYDERASQIPVHISQRDILANSLSTIIDPPTWYEEHIHRVINLKESKENRKTIDRDNWLKLSESLQQCSQKYDRKPIAKNNNLN